MSPITTAVTVLALAFITLGIVRYLGLEHPWLQPWALLRAAIQLGILSVILSGIIKSDWWVALFLVVMAGGATWTVYRRLRLDVSTVPKIVFTIVVSAAVPLLVIFAAHALEFSARYLLAIGGIVIGGTMTVTTLMGRELGSRLKSQRDEIEAWLAVGATRRFAARDAVRASASTALIPSTDQTRMTGVVTLPGAFVGAIFAGASPLAAAQFQLIVLAAILAASAIAVACLTWFFGVPGDLSDRDLKLR